MNARPYTMFADRPKFRRVLYISDFGKHLVIFSVKFVQFSSIFQWSPPIGKSRMTSVSFVKTKESYEVRR